ncbi:MAG: hypothetical protein ACRDOJ_06960, partial [Nocardioidaceae bacterium]
MSDYRGLSIFDETDESGPAHFPTARRGGYDRAAVDRFVAANESGRQEAATALKSTRQRVHDLEAEVASLREQLAEASEPTYSGLGGRASELLRLAEEQAADVTKNAHREAEHLRQQAEHDAAALRADAATEAEDMRSVQRKEIDDLRVRATTDAEAERKQARSEATDLVASAKREAEQMRLAAQQETTGLRTTARREAEQARSAADREVQEARRTLAVEKERLTKEAAERHTQALEETKRLLDD